MLLYDKKFYKQQIIYIFALFIFLTSTILSNTIWIYSLGDDFALFLKLMRYISYVICIFKVIFDKFYFSDFWKISIIMLLVVVAGFFSVEMRLFTYSFIFIATYKIEKKMLIKCVIYIQSCLWFIVVFSSQIGLNVDYIFDAGERNRHGLGFTWTTTPAILFFFIFLEYAYIRKRRMRNIEYILILGMSCVLFRLTDARLTFYISVMSVVCFWLLNNTKIIRLIMKKMRAIWLVVPSFIAVFSFFIHRYYEAGNWVWEKWNSLLSGRLELGSSAIKQYGITLFGQDIEWVGHGYQEIGGIYNYVDCSYLQILIRNGVVFWIICLVIYTYILLKSTQEEDYHLCGCILIILVFSITEPFLLHLMFNPFPLLAVSYLSERKNK